MPVVYKLLTGLIALVGDLSLVITGNMHPLFIGLGSIMFIGYWRAIKGLPQANRYVTAGLSIVAFCIFLADAFIISRDVIVSVGHLSLLWHALKSFDMKDHWDPLQVFFMALIQLFLASELTRSVLFGVLFMIFIVALVYAVVYSHFIKEGLEDLKGMHKPVVVITSLVLLFTVVFFVSTPRLRGGLLGSGSRRALKSGFTEEVNLGSLGQIKEDYTVVMRVTVRPMPSGTLYWRGITYEIYLEGEWIDASGVIKSLRSNRGVFTIAPSRDNLYRQDILLEPLDTELVFTLKGPKTLRVPYRQVMLSNDGAIYVKNKKDKRLRYIVQSSLEPDRTPPEPSVHLQLPEQLQKLRRLANEITRNAVGPKEKSEKILQYLKANYKYSLRIQSPPSGQDPVEHFLFQQKKGYCEHFAAAMVLLLRASGVPARLVTGYAGGQFNRYGRYFIVRQKDAHTWVEAWTGQYWQEFDPTPVAIEGPPSQLALFLDYIKLKWDRYVVGFSRADQRSILRFMAMPMEHLLEIRIHRPGIRLPLWPLYLVLLVPGIFFFRRLLFRFRHPLWLRRYLNLRSKLALPPSATPEEVLTEALRRFPDRRQQTQALVRQYLKTRFGRKTQR